MAGQQHRAAVGRCLLHQLEERFLDQRVQPLGRLVQDRQLGIVLQRLHQAQFLLHAARVPAHRAPQDRGRQPQPLAQLGSPRAGPALEGTQEVEGLRPVSSGYSRSSPGR